MVGALIVGLAGGAFCVFYGAHKNQLALGLAGFVGCLLGGYSLGLILVIPTAAICMWLINKEAVKAK